MFKFTTFQVSKTWAKIDLLKELQRERKGFLTEDERKQFDEAFDDARIRLFAEKHESKSQLLPETQVFHFQRRCSLRKHRLMFV